VRRFVAASLGLAVVAASTTADAIPRYSARYQQNCTLCHQNPTGGGLRSLYASQYLVPTEMVIKPFTQEQIARIHPDVSPSVTVGTDLRTIHFWANIDRPEKNFFQMQGDLYLSFAVDDRFSANLDIDQTGSTEIYGLGWILPWSGYVKIGRFTPVFGWKFADHNMFTREELWFDQPYNTDAGVEIGFYPKHFAVWGSLLNGEPGSNTRFDQNKEFAAVGGALARFHVWEVGVGLGGSIWYNPKEPQGARDGERTAGGPYGYLNWHRLSWLWEVDASRLTIPDVSSKTKLVTSHEVSLQVQPGFDVLGTYNYVDPDLDLQTGIRQRYGLGFEVLPVPFVEIQAAVNWFESQEGLDVTEPDFTRTEVQLHLFY
jgi:hypothetical protein